MVFDFSETLDEPPSPLSPPFAEIKPSPMGAGLANLGNTCFLNAVLQCFTHTVPFVESLRSFDHATPCRCDGGFCLFCALREHVELSLASTGGVIAPLKLVENLSYFSSFFQRFQQEDAHEFLQCMLDRLCSCVEFCWQDKALSPQGNSFVKQIFGGRLRSRVICCNCGHCSDTYEPVNDLSLEIEGVDTLSTALESFTQVEKIDAEAKFTCGNCKEEVLAEKQLTIDQAPEIGVLHLKRFKSDGLYVEKINEFVNFPLELDLQPFMSNPNGDCNDSWHRLDDSKVIRVSEDHVLNQEAYILFYKRQGSPWFSSLMEAQQTCVHFGNTSTSPRSVLEDAETAAIPSTSGETCSGSEVDEPTNAPSTTSPVSSSPDILPNAKEPIDAPSTPPPVFSSSDIHPEESTATASHASDKVTYQIPRAHLSQEWKTPATKVLEDGRSRQSLSRLLRRMPTSRSSQLLACISPQSEGSLSGSKRRRMSMSDAPRSYEKVRPSTLPWDIHQTVVQSLASGDSNF